LGSYFVYVLTRAVILCVRTLPRSIAVGLIRAFGMAAYYLDSRHRRIAAVNLKIAFPEFSRVRRSRIARRSFQNTIPNLD
jgi:lauroyl/myristoyl acyltransferase